MENYNRTLKESIENTDSASLPIGYSIEGYIVTIAMSLALLFLVAITLIVIRKDSKQDKIILIMLFCLKLTALCLITKFIIRFIYFND